MPNTSETIDEILSDINKAAYNIETLLPTFKYSAQIRAECESILMKTEEIREKIKKGYQTNHQTEFVH
jgi:hypothetical protein